MALIVEVLDRVGTVLSRVRIGDRPLTVGRAFDNDVILDDMYVDARHARIHVAEDGSVEIEDLGSINGLVQLQGKERMPRLAVQPGTQVQLGRTILRFRDPDEPVPPALTERAAAGLPVHGLLDKPWWRAAMCIGAVALVILLSWLMLYERQSAAIAIGIGIGYLLFGALWCGAWAVASRAVLGRFNFFGHFAVFSGLTIPGLLYSSASAWVLFIFPDNPISAPVGFAVWLFLTTASIALHLGFASTMNRFRRWRAGAITAGAITVMFGLLAWAGSEVFTDVPTFNAILKPVDTRILPAKDVAGFSELVQELVQEADEMAED